MYFDPSEFEQTDEHIDSQYEDYFLDQMLDESSECDPNEGHREMWHDFDQINEDDIPY
jgi:hypothetical protein